MSEVISMQISVSGPRGKGMKRSGQRSMSQGHETIRWKVKVTRARNDQVKGQGHM